MPQADGTILIDTEIDADGMKAGSKEVEAAVRKMADSMTDTTTKAKTAINKQVDAFSKLNQEFAAQSKKVDELKKKVAEYGNQKIPTQEYKEIQSQIDAASKKMERLVDMQEKFLAMGGSQNSKQYKSYQYDIDQLANTIKYAEGELRDLEETGKAFSLGNQTKQAAADMEKLAAAERKLSDMNNRLGTSYSSIKGRMNDYNKSLTKIDSAQKKTSESGNKIAKSLTNTAKASNKASFGIGKMLGTSILFSFVFQAINGAMTALTEGFTNLAQYSSTTNNSISMLWSSLERLKNSLATAFAPILDVIAPILSGFINMLSQAITYVGMFFAALTGRTTFTKALGVQKDYAASLQDTSSSASSAADSTEDQADALEDATKAAEGYLSPIDEINKINSEQPSSSGSSGIPGLGGGGIGGGTENLFEEVPIDNFLNDLAKKLKEIGKLFKKGFQDGIGNVQPILDEIKKDIDSIGKSLRDIFTDPEVNAAMSNFGESLVYNLGKITGAIARVGLAIAENLIGGIESYLSENTDRIKNHLISIFNVGAEIMDLLGNIAADFAEVFSDVIGSQTAQNITGNIIGIFSEIGLTAIDLGLQLGRDIISAITRPFTENKEAIKTALLQTLEPIEVVTQSIEDLVQRVSDKVISVYNENVAPFFTSLGDGLSSIFGKLLDGYNTYMVPVLDGLATKFSELMEGPVGSALNSIVRLIGQLFETLNVLWKNVLQPIFEWIAETIMPVLAPIVDFVGTAILDAIGAVITIFGSLVDTMTALLQFVEDAFSGKLVTAFENLGRNLENIWQNLGKYFSNILNGMYNTAKRIVGNIKNTAVNLFNNMKDSIINVFESISNKAKSVFDSMVDIVSQPLNWIIDKLNGLISAAESAQNWIADALSFSIDIPWPVSDLVGFDNFTIGVDRISLPRIPYLASGAVIPPNKQFMAVLGDQKQGNNIEAPEALIRRIVREETASSGGNTYRIPIEVSGRKLTEIVIDEAKLRQARNGENPFALGGSF